MPGNQMNNVQRSLFLTAFREAPSQTALPASIDAEAEIADYSPVQPPTQA